MLSGKPSWPQIGKAIFYKYYQGASLLLNCQFNSEANCREAKNKRISTVTLQNILSWIT